MERDVCAVVEVPVYKSNRRGMARCRNLSEVSHMLAELGDESQCQYLAGDSQGLTVYELSC
jgi:hypothetical protein